MEMSKVKTICIALMLLLSVALLPKHVEAKSLHILADAAILIDADSGKILYEQHANTPLGIAEITKMMTAFLVLEAVESGKLQWEQQVSVSDYTYSIASREDIRTVNMEKDVNYTVKALYEALVVYNANDAAVALAEAVAGSEVEFVTLMNKKAKELQLSSYKFVNASGLNNSYLGGMHPDRTGPNDENVMPARSVAKLAYALYTKYPDILNLSKQSTITFNEGSTHSFPINNWNKMLPGQEYEYQNVSGLFGGHSSFAGYTMLSFAQRNDQKLIAVVMKAVDETGVESEQAMYKETSNLLDYGFANFKTVEILPAGYQIKDQESIPVIKGEQGEAKVKTAEPITLMLQESELELYKPVLLLDVEYLEAPVEKGELVGKLLLERSEGEDYGFITGEAILVDVVTASNVNSAEPLKLFFQGIAAFWRTLWHEANDLVENNE